jgi:predicted ATPase
MQVIGGRLAQLSDENRELLQIAAVIGQDVPVDLWQQVSGASDDALIGAIEQGRAAQLLEEVGGTSYRFRHALLREALYEEVIAFRRRIWHRQIAEVRSNLPNPDPDLVAYHFQQAGDARAVDWLLQAAERASRAFTPRMAAERLEAVVALYQEQGRSPTSYYKLLFAIGSLRRYGSDQRTIAYLTEVATAACAAGDLFMAALADAERGLSRFMLGEFRDGLIVLERAVDEGLYVLAQDSDVLNQSVGPIYVWDADSYQSFFASRTSIRTAFWAYV